MKFSKPFVALFLIVIFNSTYAQKQDGKLSAIDVINNSISALRRKGIFT